MTQLAESLDNLHAQSQHNEKNEINSNSQEYKANKNKNNLSKPKEENKFADTKISSEALLSKVGEAPEEDEGSPSLYHTNLNLSEKSQISAKLHSEEIITESKRKFTRSDRETSGSIKNSNYILHNEGEIKKDTPILEEIFNIYY
jgi:antitoxin component of MazEF toxin-antitoxin module